MPHCTFDVELLGDCDTIVNQICLMLGEVGSKFPSIYEKTYSQSQNKEILIKPFLLRGGSVQCTGPGWNRKLVSLIHTPLLRLRWATGMLLNRQFKDVFLSLSWRLRRGRRRRRGRGEGRRGESRGKKKRGEQKRRRETKGRG